MMRIWCINCKTESHIDRDPSKGGVPRDYCDLCRENIRKDQNNQRMCDRYRQARMAGASSQVAGAMARSSNAKFQEALASLKPKA